MVSTGDQLAIECADLRIERLGEPTVAVADGAAAARSGEFAALRARVRPRAARRHRRDGSCACCAVAELPSFEPGGPRELLFFEPADTRVAIITCGGLCPGLNNVIRGLVLELSDHYGVDQIVGFANGYSGLVKGDEPVALTRSLVADIHNRGGTILGTSRGDQDADAMVDTLDRLHISVLFVIGGDGTLRGAQAIADAAAKRGLALSVVGVPKTIDNDIPYIDHSFGFQTAFSRAADSIKAAHTEASSTLNGVGLVKLMGRHSGFIACYAALANHEVDFVLVPEVPFALDGPRGFLGPSATAGRATRSLRRRGRRRRGPGFACARWRARRVRQPAVGRHRPVLA